MFFGGGKRDRTADLLHAMQALSQLSYTPVYFRIRILKSTTIREGAILMTGGALVNEFMLIRAYSIGIQIAVSSQAAAAASLFYDALQ